MSTAAQVVGNVTRDPELRFSASGTPVATLSVAVNRRTKDAAGEWIDAPAEFYDVVAFRDLAEHVAESIGKGDRLVILGRLSFRSWETDAGEKRSRVEIVADEIAPSLRYATAQVTRTERHAGALSPQATTGHPDEEPF